VIGLGPRALRPWLLTCVSSGLSDHSRAHFGAARHGVCPSRESNTPRETLRERTRNERLAMQINTVKPCDGPHGESSAERTLPAVCRTGGPHSGPYRVASLPICIANHRFLRGARRFPRLPNRSRWRSIRRLPSAPLRLCVRFSSQGYGSHAEPRSSRRRPIEVAGCGRSPHCVTPMAQAPKGRKSIATGVSPWVETPLQGSPEGAEVPCRVTFAPSGVGAPGRLPAAYAQEPELPSVSNRSTTPSPHLNKAGDGHQTVARIA
jgi:hypothetical protein